MIDLKQEIKDFHEINLEELGRSQSNLPDDITNSIILYNKAIDSLRTGSEDIAMIELKKATSINPHFYEALNLLGLCYSYKNETAKASEIFNRIIKEENNSIKALKYLNAMNSNDSAAVSREKSKKGRSVEAAHESQNNRETANTSVFRKLAEADKIQKARNMNIIKLAAAFAAGALLVFFIGLLTPETAKPVDASVMTGSTGNTDSQAGADGKDYKALYEELSGKYALLQNDKDTANHQVDYYKALIKLYDAESLVSEKQYEKAADMLLLLKTTEFKGDDKARFDDLIKTVMPRAAWEVFNQGYSMYNAKDYQNALKKLQKVELYDPGFERTDALLYYMGKSSQLLNDSRNAIALFQRLINTYPDSSYARNAKIRIQSLMANP